MISAKSASIIRALPSAAPDPHMPTNRNKTGRLQTSSPPALSGLRRSRLAPLFRLRRRTSANGGPGLHMPTSKVPTGAEQTKC